MQHSTPSNNHHFTQTQLHFTHQKPDFPNNVIKKPRPIVIEKLMAFPQQHRMVDHNENLLSGRYRYIKIAFLKQKYNV